MVFLRSVRIAFPPRPGRQRRVVRKILPGRRAGEYPQDRRCILQRRHDLLDRCDDDVDLGERLGEISIALIGDDDRCAGLGDQEIRTRDADLSFEIRAAQDLARLLDERRDLAEIAIARELVMSPAEVRLDLLAGQMDCGGDDMARPFLSELDQIFAKIGLDCLEPLLLKGVVELDLFRDHRLPLGHELRARPLADAEDETACFLGGLRPVHFAARLDHLPLVMLEIDIEIGEDMILDVARDVAQTIELGKGSAGLGTLGDEPRAGFDHCTLKMHVGEGAFRIDGEEFGRLFHHSASAMAGTDTSLARTSAT